MNVNLTPGKPGASGNQVWERAGVAMNVNLTPGKPGASGNKWRIVATPENSRSREPSGTELGYGRPLENESRSARGTYYIVAPNTGG
jgi:hypothetical protein